jgi:hypothetical protein
MPCSGDDTLRKLSEMRHDLSLHKLQLGEKEVADT